MGNQDQTEKMLLDFNDEFAEVFSVLVFKNKIKIDPNRLQDAATEYHHFEKGNPKELRRDIVKRYDGARLGFILLGIENQSDVDTLMPIRLMGYNWTRYRYQASQANTRPPERMLEPVFAHVINFSYKKKWDWPLALKDIVQVPNELEEFFQDYKITVTNVAWLTPEDRSLLTGDFRILADTLCAVRETGEIPGSTQTIRHLEELLATLAAITHRQYTIPQLTDTTTQGDMTMDDVFAQWEQKFIDQGYEQGQKEGFENGQNSSAVRACQRFGKSEDETMHYLMLEYGMTKDDARTTTKQYWMQ